MQIMTNNEQIRELINSNKLTYRQAADKTGFSYYTIRAWMVDSSSERHRNVPTRTLEAFKSKLGDNG